MYVGYTGDLESRLHYHNSGKVTATENSRPWRVLYSEMVDSSVVAKDRERYWKSGAGRRNLKKIFGGPRPTFRTLGEARSNKV